MAGSTVILSSSRCRRISSPVRRSRRRRKQLLGPRWPQLGVADLSAFVSQGLFRTRLFRTANGVSCTRTSAPCSKSQSSTVTMSWSRRERVPGRPSASCSRSWQLVRESVTWPAPGPRPAQWDWWNHWSMQGKHEALGSSDCRSGRMRTGRPPVRALILYPLNALVEDQLARLRDGLGRRWCASLAPSASVQEIGSTLGATQGGHPYRGTAPRQRPAGCAPSSLMRIATRSSSQGYPRHGSSRTWTAARCGRAGTCRTTRLTS